MYDKFILVGLLIVGASLNSFATLAASSNSSSSSGTLSKRIVNQPASVIGTQAITLNERRDRQEEIDRIQKILDDRRRTPPASP